MKYSVIQRHEKYNHRSGSIAAIDVSPQFHIAAQNELGKRAQRTASETEHNKAQQKLRERRKRPHVEWTGPCVRRRECSADVSEMI